jgi:glycosyltransferase involved in cell wall biosynthesis
MVIPALNEEEAIGDTIQRCLDARVHIVENSRVDDVEIIVVSDGSTDRTEEIARAFEGVTVLAFERNRGYGAAIKCGFEHGRGDLVGFLDADGTCDPQIFAKLCRAIDEEGADVVLGSRTGPESRMPWVRTVGNTIFALMLGILSKRSVRDTASGMRVIRRECLLDLYPLPDGLHFTPAMSAGILLAGRLKLLEVSMPYAERLGRSKLSVVQDGIRFFRVIIQAAMCYHPARPLLLVASLLAVLSLAVVLGPLTFYLRFGNLEEWMIYRVLMSSLLMTGVALLVCAAVVAERVAATAHNRSIATSGVTRIVGKLFVPTSRRIGGTVLLTGAVIFAWPGIVEYATTGEVYMHWSRAVLAALLLVLAAVLAITTFLMNMMDLIQAQRAGMGPVSPPDRVHPARSGQS